MLGDVRGPQPPWLQHAPLCVGIQGLPSDCTETRSGLSFSFLTTAAASEMQEQWQAIQEAQAAYQRGIQLQQRGDAAGADAALNTAAEAYRQVLSRNPLRIELYEPLSDIQIRRGQAAAAYALLIKQVRDGVSDVGVRMQVVRALQAMKRPQKALVEVQQLLQSQPSSPEVAGLAGEIAAEAGNIDLAIRELQRALPKIAPQDHPHGVDGIALRKLLSRLLIEKQRGSEALGILNVLHRAQPSDTDVQILQGQALLSVGKAADAAEVLRKVLAASPGQPRAQSLLGQAVAESGQISEGITLLQGAGESTEVLLVLGKLYQRKEPPDLNAAQAALTKATLTQPSNLRACQELAQLFVVSGSLLKAQTEIERCTAPLLVADAPPPAEGLGEAQRALALRADIELRQSRFDEAQASLRAAIQQTAGGGPMQGVLRTRLAQVIMRRGLSKLPATVASTPTTQPVAAGTAAAALADLQEAYKLQPSATTGHALAVGLLSAGKSTEALQLLNPLVDSNPNDPRLLGTYGQTLREAGQLLESRLALQKAESLVAPAGVAPAGANVPLRKALRQELAVTMMAMKKPVEALRLLDGTDELTQQLRAQANLVSARTIYAVTQPATVRAAAPQSPAERTPAPPAAGPPTYAPQPLDFRALMFVTQAALKSGPGVLPVQRAEAKLWQVLGLLHTGQSELGAKLLTEVAAAFDTATLESLLGRGGFVNLQAQVTLRGGDFYQGVNFAQQAMLQQPPEIARALQNILAAAYTSKAIEVLPRSELDRVMFLLRTAVVQCQGGPPQNLARAQYNLAALQLMRNRPEEARAILQKLDPQLLPDTLVGLGLYFEAVGDSKQALESYRRYLQLVTGNPAVPPPAQAEKVQKWIDVLSRIHESPQHSSLPMPRLTAGRSATEIAHVAQLRGHKRHSLTTATARIAATQPQQEKVQP